MTRICAVTGKRPMSGHAVSHSNRKTNRWFRPNLHEKRFWLESENRSIKLRVSAKGLRIIDKKGIESVLSDIKNYNK